MCFNHVKVHDKYRKQNSYTYFSCGKCVSCRQALSNRRALKIRSHHPDGYIAYFVTLTYSNSFLPYIKISDLNSIYQDNFSSVHIPQTSDLLFTSELSDYLNSITYNSFYDRFISLDRIRRIVLDDSHNTYCIPVYRDTHFTRNKSRRFSRGTRCIDYIDIDSPFYPVDINSLHIISSRRRCNTSKVSISYTPDWQNFIKRLRITLFRRYGQVVPLSYYYAPEYGPTTQRFHIHALIWFPSFLTSSEIKSAICKAWPFCSKDFICRYTQVARDASSYVASYATSSCDVSPFLSKIAPLRSSHSLHFGFDNLHFDLAKIIAKFRQSRCVTYPIEFTDTNGRFVSIDVPYPQYVLRTYFPKLKGWSRMSESTRNLLITNVEKFRLYDEISYISDKGIAYYRSNIYDVYGRSMYYSIEEVNCFISSLNRAFYYFLIVSDPDKPLPNIIDYYFLHRDFYNRYKSYLYINSQSNSTLLDNILQFNNLDTIDFIPEWQIPPSIKDHVLSLNISLHPDHLPYNIIRDDQLISKYKQHLKTRKLNYYYG